MTLRIIRLLAILALTGLTACGGLVPRGGNGLAQQRFAQTSDYANVAGGPSPVTGEEAAVILNDAKRGIDNFVTTMLVGAGILVLVGGAIWAGSSSDAGAAAKPDAFKHAPNVNTPDFVRRALVDSPGL